MGEVVAFRMREKSSRDESAPRTGDAQILFFLGVRYARLDAPTDASPDHGEGRGHGQGPRGGKKRKSRARA